MPYLPQPGGWRYTCPLQPVRMHASLVSGMQMCNHDKDTSQAATTCCMRSSLSG